MVVALFHQISPHSSERNAVLYVVGSSIKCSVVCSESQNCFGYAVTTSSSPSVLSPGCELIDDPAVAVVCSSLYPLLPCYQKHTEGVSTQDVTTEGLTTGCVTVC